MYAVTWHKIVFTILLKYKRIKFNRTKAIPTDIKITIQSICANSNTRIVQNVHLAY